MLLEQYNVETKQQVAEGAFCDPDAKYRISYLENGKLKPPRAKMVNAIYTCFDISSAELAELSQAKASFNHVLWKRIEVLEERLVNPNART